MWTPRELSIAALSCVATLGAVACVQNLPRAVAQEPAPAPAVTDSAAPAADAEQPKPIMRSRSWDWDELDASDTGVGQFRYVCKDPTATLDELEMHVTVLNAGDASHEPHRHANEELVILTEGSVEVYQNGARRRLGPGSIMFMASNELHAVTNVGDQPAKYYVINWRSPGE